MGGRGSSGSVTKTKYSYYYNFQTGKFDRDDAYKALGYQNGGETDMWVKNLSGVEKEAIKDYSDTYYSSINKYLRGEETPVPIVIALERALHTALNKYELKENIVVNRVDNGGLLTEKFISKIAKGESIVGEVISNKGYTSSSVSKGFSWTDFRNYLYRIKTPKGKGIGAFIEPISFFKGGNEQEFLFNKNAAFKVTGVRNYGGQYAIDLEYIGTV